jgi:hypothetical protein
MTDIIIRIRIKVYKFTFFVFKGSIEQENVIMKRDIDIMKIRLKQFEQLQQLTSMLQESHK